MIPCGICHQNTPWPIFCRMDFYCPRCYTRLLWQGHCDRCDYVGNLYPTRSCLELICENCQMAEARWIIDQFMKLEKEKRNGRK